MLGGNLHKMLLAFLVLDQNSIDLRQIALSNPQVNHGNELQVGFHHKLNNSLVLNTSWLPNSFRCFINGEMNFLNTSI